MTEKKIISTSPWETPSPAPKKKLIEVALPLEAINKASVRESYIYRGNPSAMHKWWAQRPLAAARAVIFAQMVDDPSEHPDLFPTDKKQEKERQRLFRIIENLVVWENNNNEKVLQQAHNEIWQSWRYTCAENADHPLGLELFDRYALPMFFDPFAGGGTLPLEAQRLGLQSHASDLNPVAVLINTALLKIPPTFRDRPPVNPRTPEEKRLLPEKWKGAQGLAEDVLYYGKWMRNEAERLIGHLYPKVEITAEMAVSRPDLVPDIGKQMDVIAWLWARTVKSPNPAFATVDVPLASTFMLSTKAGREIYVEPIIGDNDYHFNVKLGRPTEASKVGTKLARGANFRCIMSGTPISPNYIYSEANAGRMDARLMAVVVHGSRGRVYLPPVAGMEAIARKAKPSWKPDLPMPENPRWFSPPLYGLKSYGDLFTPRQLVALTTFSALVQETRKKVREDCHISDFPADDRGLDVGGSGAQAYADAVATLLAFSLDKTAEYNCTIVPWYAKEDRPKGLFARQAIPMVWDYAEVNPLSDIGGSLGASIEIVSGALAGCYAQGQTGRVCQLDAVELQRGATNTIISTDPPYYDNIGYADLSDFFYVWLRHSLKSVFPDLFCTIATPKIQELVATPYRHGGKEKAESFFMAGMTEAMRRLAEHAHPSFPVTIYYAFKQAESSSSETVSTGWETFLDAVITAGFSLSGTWPIRTERTARSTSRDANALASSIVLVCRPRKANSPIATRREFVAALKAELPVALALLQRGNIAPVDLAQASIGPGMAVYTRFARVVDAEGKPLTVREALALINQTLDEALAEQEGEFDADSRWALAWFEQYGFGEGDYGVAEVLSKAKVTSVQGLKEAGILDKKSPAGKVRLLRPEELSNYWNPVTDARLTAWEIVHHLIHVLEVEGESGSAALVAKLGAKAEAARELCYRLYTLCERKKRAAEALSYNGLVQSWPEIMRLAREGGTNPHQETMFPTSTEE